MSQSREIDEISGAETTGHSWDGIKELNNPLPRWWLWTLYATIVYAIGYAIAYPALPGLTGATQGWLGWSSRADLHQELAATESARAAQIARIASSDINAILADAELRTFATAAGASIFKVRCAACHGSGAEGRPGYPNLNDDSWLWGGTPEQIRQSIAHGIRDSSDPETRLSEMPAYGRDNLLEPKQISEAAHFVMQMSKQPHDAASAAAGAKIYVDNCAACHGERGEGNKDLGSPQLNDAIWFYGGTIDAVSRQISLPRHGVMPAWQARLGDVSVKQLASYVHSLGGGE